MSLLNTTARSRHQPRVTLFLFATVCWLAWPTPAQAELVVLSCPGTEVAAHSPALTNTPTSTAIHAHGVVGPCVGLPLGVVSAVYDLYASGVVSCSSGSAAVSSFVVNWSDGSASGLTLSGVVVQRLAGQVIRVETSTVTAGRFLGATVVRTVTLLETGFLACGTPQGVPSLAGPVTMTVAGT